MFTKKVLKVTALAVFTGALLSGCGMSQQAKYADDLNNTGVRYYNQHNYEMAVDYYTKAAELGNKYAQSNLGGMYRKGKGVPVDYNKSFYYYKKSADQGHKKGYFGLALAYEYGFGVEQNYQLAAKYYELSGKEGRNNLAGLYWDGFGVKKDLDKAKSLYEEIILDKPSYGLAYSNLGGIYQDKKDYSTAIDYFEKAGQLGEANGFYKLGELYRKGKGVAVDYTKAVQYYEKAINASKTDSLTAKSLAKARLALMLENGQGVTKDPARAKELYQQSLQKLIDYSNNFILGEIYRDSPSLGNKAKAREAFSKACKNNSNNACEALKTL